MPGITEPVSSSGTVVAWRMGRFVSPVFIEFASPKQEEIFGGEI